MAYVVAIHEIQDPDRFWSIPPEFPEGLTLHSTYPREDGTRAVCLWEADSADTVREVIDGAAGDFSRNEFFEVDTQHPGIRGLPKSAAAQA